MAAREAHVRVEVLPATQESFDFVSITRSPPHAAESLGHCEQRLPPALQNRRLRGFHLGCRLAYLCQPSLRLRSSSCFLRLLHRTNGLLKPLVGSKLAPLARMSIVPRHNLTPAVCNAEIVSEAELVVGGAREGTLQ